MWFGPTSRRARGEEGSGLAGVLALRCGVYEVIHTDTPPKGPITSQYLDHVKKIGKFKITFLRRERVFASQEQEEEPGDYAHRAHNPSPTFLPHRYTLFLLWRAWRSYFFASRAAGKGCPFAVRGRRGLLEMRMRI